MYRYHTLPAARQKARILGYRGALYAWESADDGHESTPTRVRMPNGEVVRILTGEQEHHISADIAYAVWHYWQATGDDEFFLEAGARSCWRPPGSGPRAGSKALTAATISPG